MPGGVTFHIVNQISRSRRQRNHIVLGSFQLHHGVLPLRAFCAISAIFISCLQWVRPSWKIHSGSEGSSSTRIRCINMRPLSSIMRSVLAPQDLHSSWHEDQSCNGRSEGFSRQRHALIEANDFVVNRPTIQAPGPVKARQGPLSRIQQVLHDHKAATASAAHDRGATCTGEGVCEGRRSTQVGSVEWAGPSPSICVMSLTNNVLMRRRAFPSSRPH